MSTAFSTQTAQSQVQSNYATNVVAVIDPDTGSEMFNSANLMKANVSPTSKLLDHPREDGSTTTDFKVDQPIVIDMGILIDSLDEDDTYDQIDNARISATLFSIQTNAGVFENMIIQSCPHDETPDMFGMLAMNIKFREVLVATAQFQALQPTQVANANDQSTINRGEQTGQSSVLYDIGKTFGITGGQ